MLVVQLEESLESQRAALLAEQKEGNSADSKERRLVELLVNLSEWKKVVLKVGTRVEWRVERMELRLAASLVHCWAERMETRRVEKMVALKVCRKVGRLELRLVA